MRFIRTKAALVGATLALTLAACGDAGNDDEGSDVGADKDAASSLEDGTRMKEIADAGLWVPGVGIWLDLVRVPPFEPAPRLTAEALASEFVFELRWWPVAELPSSGAAFAPASRATSTSRTELEEFPDPTTMRRSASPEISFTAICRFWVA